MLALFWGGSFVAIKILIEDVPSFSAAFLRVFLATIFLIIYFFPSLRKEKFANKKSYFVSALTGLCSIGIPFSLLFWGENYIAPSIAGVINGTVPIWTLIIALIFMGDLEKITKKKLIGLLFGLIGIAFIFAPKLTLTGKEGELMGMMAIVLMAIFYAIGINLNKRILAKFKIPNSHNLIIQHTVSALYLLALVVSIETFPKIETLLMTKNFISILYLSLISTTLAFIIFFRLIQNIGPVRASSVTFFVPAVALILDGLIYGHRLTMTEGIGAAIIFVSMGLLRETGKKVS